MRWHRMFSVHWTIYNSQKLRNHPELAMTICHVHRRPAWLSVAMIMKPDLKPRSLFATHLNFTFNLATDNPDACVVKQWHFFLSSGCSIQIKESLSDTTIEYISWKVWWWYEKCTFYCQQICCERRTALKCFFLNCVCCEKPFLRLRDIRICSFYEKKSLKRLKPPNEEEKVRIHTLKRKNISLTCHSYRIMTRQLTSDNTMNFTFNMYFT